MPMLGSYLMPRSMCSWMPKPKFPVSEKLFFLNSYSRTWKQQRRTDLQQKHEKIPPKHDRKSEYLIWITAHYYKYFLRRPINFHWNVFYHFTFYSDFKHYNIKPWHLSVWVSDTKGWKVEKDHMDAGKTWHGDTDLESLLQDLLCFGSTDGAVDSNLFISANSEGSHSVAGCRRRRKQKQPLSPHNGTKWSEIFPKCSPFLLKEVHI